MLKVTSLSKRPSTSYYSYVTERLLPTMNTPYSDTLASLPISLCILLISNLATLINILNNQHHPECSIALHEYTHGMS